MSNYEILESGHENSYEYVSNELDEVLKSFVITEKFEGLQQWTSYTKS